MKNTKIYFTALLLSITCLTFGQLTANFGVGYHTGAFGNLSGGYSEKTNAAGETTATFTNGNIGGGIPITLGIGYGITDNIAFDANFEYLLGRSVVLYETEGSSFDFKNTVSSTQIRFVPSLIFKSGNSGLYGRLGAALDLGGKMTYVSTSGFSPSTSTITREETVNLNVGVVMGLGYNLSLGDNLTFFGELQALAMNRSAKSSEVVEYSDDRGRTLESSYPTVRSRETEYVSEYTEEAGSTPDDSQPRKSLSYKTPYGSFGLNIGIRFTLNNK